MNTHYPNPPHVVAGYVVKGAADSAMRGLAAATAEAGAQSVRQTHSERGNLTMKVNSEPLLLNIVFDGGDNGVSGVEFVASGDVLSLPEWIPLGPEEAARAAAGRAFIRRAFRAGCASLVPLYAAVGVEWRIPRPTELVLHETWIPGDLYWSNELEFGDPGLTASLEGIFEVRSVALGRGRMLTAGAMLEPSTPSPAKPLEAGRNAARRLARAVALT